MKLIPILMAEDDPEDQLLTRIALEKAKLRNPLFCVDDGQQAINYLTRKPPFNNDKHPMPGLIILDLNMPKKDGLTTLKEIKANEQIAHIPVVILTTSSEEEEIIKSYHEGAASYISKPVSLDKLIKIMQRLGQYWFSIVEDINE